MQPETQTPQYSALDIAEYVISQFCGEDKRVDEGVAEGISNLKLQKLLYFCQAFLLVFSEKPMFKEEIYAWKYGPVVKEVYEKYKEHKNRPLSNTQGSNLDSKTKKMVGEVLQTFGGYSAIRLMEITHSHKPWKDLQKKIEKGELDLVITHKAIKKYYTPILSG